MNGVILKEGLVDVVFVIGGGKDLGNDEFFVMSYNSVFIVEVGVFE